ncbi:MAG: hypothetical protein JXA43_00350, partial [Candidatus Diapherotrites archaeon]|nr:hypothetical protein [Candidatus Diapherotrites archaeon]
EKLEVDKDAREALYYASEGDLRMVTNLLQSAASIETKITADNIFAVASRAKPKEVMEMIEFALDCKFLDAREKLDTLMYKYGMSGDDVIRQMYKEFIKMEKIDDMVKIELVDKIGEYNFRLVEGANERIQLEALLAQFGLYKTKKKK